MAGVHFAVSPSLFDEQLEPLQPLVLCGIPSHKEGVQEGTAEACGARQAKYWSCCPGKKCYDWDDFLKVPPCAVGPHKV